MIPLVDLKAQYGAIKKEIDSAISRVINNASFIGGEEVEKFEEEFARAVNAPFCVSVSSGTMALEISLKALGIGGGHEVITTPHTFVAISEAIVNTGALPVFVDIDEETYNIDPKKIENAITPRTRVILPVHLYGYPADLEAITTIAKKHNLMVLEDCAQAHGATSSGSFVPHGTGAFSFFPGKNLGAYGDAGAVVTRDEKLAKRIAAMRDHGRTTKYEHHIAGTNVRMDAIQAAVLRAKLPFLASWVQKRRLVAKRYSEMLADLPLQPPRIEKEVEHAFHLYVIRVKNRSGLMEHLKKADIATGIHYPIPLHLQPVYAHLGYKRGDFPIAEKISDEIVSLPIYPELTLEQVDFISSKIREFFSQL